MITADITTDITLSSLLTSPLTSLSYCPLQSRLQLLKDANEREKKQLENQVGLVPLCLHCTVIVEEIDYRTRKKGRERKRRGKEMRELRRGRAKRGYKMKWKERK